MAWELVATESFPVPADQGYRVVAIPFRGDAIAYALQYVPLAGAGSVRMRVGYYGAYLATDGEFLIGRSTAMIPSTSQGQPLLNYVDLTPFAGIAGVINRPRVFGAYVDLLPYTPPGRVEMVVLV